LGVPVGRLLCANRAEFKQGGRKMLTITKTLVILATAGAAAMPVENTPAPAGATAMAKAHVTAGESAPIRRAARRMAPSHDSREVQYSKNQKEFYWTDDEKSWARPGFTVEIVGVEIPADRYPVVELMYYDDLGQPLDRNGIETPGTISFSFVFAWYDGTLNQYTAYTVRPAGDFEQATSDSGGSWEDVGIGHSFYTFGTQLPEGYDMTKTHTMYTYATRNTEEQLGKTYYSDPTYDFRPDGVDVTEQWGSMFESTCNSCHHDLALHGGRRRALKGCMMCHNPQSTDPESGNTVNMKEMGHKIHMGANLPSVQAGNPYFIVGYRGSVHDYSEVHFPQDIRNCTTCHDPDAPEAYRHMVNPTRVACGSCHDNIDWETGEGHPVPQFDDSLCSACHIPEGEYEFDISVAGGHTIPTKSTQLAGLNMDITDVTDVAPGATPTVYFTLTNDDGTAVTPISALRTLNLRAAGPQGQTIDYTIDLSQDAREAGTSGDEYMATFEDPLPEDATGTWTFSADVRRSTTIDDLSFEGLEVTEGAFNPIFFATVTDSEVDGRREVVSMEKCNTCHDTLALHGGQRFNVQECLICHRPNATDEEVRPEEELPPESIDFKWLIHRLHKGHELNVDFTVYGYRSSVHNYNHLLFPGDLRNCEACHVDGSYNVPVTEGSMEVTNPRNYYTPTRPAATACLACHDNVDAAAHAYTQTAPFGESCASCHGDGKTYSVDAVHAR
jgi:OmcA/MtrC family decaheme c-type cytochrome